ncbi:MAG: two-component system, OmpR family, sensor kinase [Actinomycetota bacterium]|nr:two-component system, OmpR family, sensor kinase [Actinomycetota bacterium]
MTLRVRLLLGLVVLSAIGLAVAGAVTYRQTRADLLARVDRQINSAAQTPELFFPAFDHSPDPKVTGAFLPPGTWAQVRAASTGDILGTKGVLTKADLTLPKTIKPGSAFTLRDPHYRVRAAQPKQYTLFVGRNQIPVQAFLIVAIPLSDVDHTLHHLFVVEVVVALAVLSALALLAWWVVKLGLRPLGQMQETAGAIAAGDLSRRIEVANEHTEVGRLGIALNEMMQQIETAFAARTASEGRLRRFVGDASHELRTPLTSIRGYAELFRRGAADRPEDLAKAMRRIEEEADRMGSLVDDMLLLARLDQGRPLERQPVDLTRITADAVDDARAVAPNRPIDYSPNGAILVPGDEARLRQVLANLLQNANRHTPAGTPVHVRVVDGEHEAVIEVADEGPGMSNEEAGRVFERFWRSDPSRTRSSGGAGLGLSIVAAIADAHGGRAEVQSETGQGSTFRVRLPHVSPMHVPPMDAAPTNVGPPAAPADVHDPGTVPVTDLDDPEPYDR